MTGSFVETLYRSGVPEGFIGPLGPSLIDRAIDSYNTVLRRLDWVGVWSFNELELAIIAYYDTLSPEERQEQQEINDAVLGGTFVDSGIPWPPQETSTD